MPAIERYDGPAFRVLRRYHRLHSDEGLMVFILSAQFGLISAKDRIPRYDRRMTPERADDLRSSVTATLRAAIVDHEPSELLICAGKTYLRALGGLPQNAPRVTVARGGQGGKLASLKAWLYER